MLEVYAYNAGKGECLRLCFADTHNIFIDTGVTSFAEQLESVCWDIQHSGQTLDVLILTHVDADHIGGIVSLLRRGWKCPFQEVRMNLTGTAGTGNIALSSRQNNEVYGQLKEQGVNVQPLLANMKLNVEGAMIHAIGPLQIKEERESFNRPLAARKDYGRNLLDLAQARIEKTDTSVNNKNSIIFIFEYDCRKFLFLADAWATDIIEALGTRKQTFDMVKLSHHGSIGNISEEFKDHLDCVNFLVCADGITHPDKQTIAKLIKWYGRVTVYSPVNWWSEGFFTKEDDVNAVKLIQREGMVAAW